MTQDLALTSTVRPPSRVHEPSPMEDVEEAPPDKGKAPKEDEREKESVPMIARPRSEEIVLVVILHLLKSDRSSHGRFHRKGKKSPSPPSSPSNSDNEASSKPSSLPCKAKQHKRQKHIACWKRSKKL